jgi:hypothetical protein
MSGWRVFGRREPVHAGAIAPEAKRIFEKETMT